CLFTLLLIGCGGSPSPSPTPTGGGGGGGGTGPGPGGPGGGGGSWVTTKSDGGWSASDGVSVAARSPPTDAALFALVCVNPSYGWAAGSAGTIIGTHDGGAHWLLERSGGTTTLRAIAFADTKNGLAVGDQGTVLRTIDGGDSWAQIAVATTADLSGVAMSTIDGQAWIVGAGGGMLASDDHRAGVDPAVTVASRGLRAIRVAAEAGMGIAAGDGGVLLLSRDGGAHWQELGLHAPGDVYGLSLSDDGQRMVAVGAGGLIWRSPN